MKVKWLPIQTLVGGGGNEIGLRWRILHRRVHCALDRLHPLHRDRWTSISRRTVTLINRGIDGFWAGRLLKSGPSLTRVRFSILHFEVNRSIGIWNIYSPSSRRLGWGIRGRRKGFLKRSGRRSSSVGFFYGNDHFGAALSHWFPSRIENLFFYFDVRTWRS